MNGLKIILQEQINYAYLIRRLSLYEIKQTYAASALGIVWAFVNPLIQVGVYWVIFGLGIRGGVPVDGIPYFLWMLSGLIPWFFISASIMQGANSIYARLSTASKMNFPLSVIPTYVIAAQLYTHLLLVFLLLIILVMQQGIHGINLLGIVYMLFSTVSFLLALAFITSTLSTVLRDIYLSIQSITRMLFFLTPILWKSDEHIPQALAVLININPIYYVVDGYRKSLLFGDISFLLSWHTVYFWGLILVLFVFGAKLHVGFRRQFVDYL